MLGRGHTMVRGISSAVQSMANGRTGGTGGSILDKETS